MSKPCEKCGHCPACGRGGYSFYPHWQWIPPRYPYYGTGDFTYRPPGTSTWITTSGNTAAANYVN